MSQRPAPDADQPVAWTAEAQLEAVMGAALQAIVLVDRDCRLVAFNQPAETYLRALGGPPPRPGERFRDCLPSSPSLVEFFEAQFGRALAGEVVHAERNLPDARGDHWFEFLYRPVRLGGAVVGVCVNALPIDARKQAEEALRAVERQSGQAEKLRALGQMATGIAHDLNQTLALVAGYSDLAHRTLDSAAPDLGRLRGMLATIAQAAMDGGESVRRLLSFARVESEGGRQPVDLRAVLREVAHLTAPRWRDAAQAEGRSIVVEVADGPALAAVGHPSALREALTNLIFNAVDALPGGGTIRLSAEQQGDVAVVAVADDGIGMPPEVRARAFEPFFTTKGERGSGLGLAQVVGIVERHGGRISIESVVGQGTTVRVALPFGRLDAAAPAGVDRPPGRRLRVLAVDDEVALVRMTEASLHQEGHEVATATSAEEAVSLLESRPFDLVLSDLGMGAGWNGWQLADEVRRRWPGTRFVLATGWAGEIDPAIARARGVDAVIGKPYRLADLRRLLDEVSRSA